MNASEAAVVRRLLALAKRQQTRSGHLAQKWETAYGNCSRTPPLDNLEGGVTCVPSCEAWQQAVRDAEALLASSEPAQMTLLEAV